MHNNIFHQSFISYNLYRMIDISFKGQEYMPPIKRKTQQPNQSSNG